MPRRNLVHTTASFGSGCIATHTAVGPHPFQAPYSEQAHALSENEMSLSGNAFTSVFMASSVLMPHILLTA